PERKKNMSPLIEPVTQPQQKEVIPSLLSSARPVQSELPIQTSYLLPTFKSLYSTISNFNINFNVIIPIEQEICGTGEHNFM
ncbi:hypothetical protein PanWU01x14_334080, partial [Parasponia andersonii]